MKIFIKNAKLKWKKCVETSMTLSSFLQDISLFLLWRNFASFQLYSIIDHLNLYLYQIAW